MKALSLTQPWATLVAIGAKRIETRSWPTNYRGPLAIHASKAFPTDDRDLCDVKPFVGALRGGGYDLATSAYRSSPLGWGKLLPRGAIVAVVDLVDVRRVASRIAREAWLEGLSRGIREPELSFGNYEPDRYGWTLASLRILPQPIPCRGALGLWTVPPDVLARIERVTANAT